MPRGWAWITVGDTGEYINGYAFKPGHREDTGRPIIRIQNLTDPTKPLNRTTLAVPSAYHVSTGEMLVSWSATVDVFVWNREPAFVNQHIFRVVPNEGLVDKNFLFHWLKVAIDQLLISEHLHGSTMKHINRGPFMAHRIQFPARREQERIAQTLEELLSDLDAGVAELKTAQRKLAQYRQSLLKTAVEGVLTADWRAARARSGEPQKTGADLLQRILTERRALWEAKQLAKYAEQGKPPPKGWQAKYPEPVSPDTTDLPQLPDGWAWASLDTLIEEGPQNGLYLPANRYGRGTPILRIDDFQIGWHRERNALNRLQADAPSTETYALKSGDIVINRVNSMTHLGKCLEVTAALDAVLFESNMMRLHLHKSVSASLVSFYLGSMAGRARLTKDAKWAVNQASINQQDVRRTPVPLPSSEEQAAVVEQLETYLGSAEAKLVAIELSLKQAAAQRKNILKAAFAGLLVPQDPNDEPASALLERIHAERAAMGQASTRKRGRKAREHG
jgi:type I restriction enzyme S subunit